MRSRKFFPAIALLVVLAFISCATAAAQYRAGIQGAVLDPQGAAVSGAAVTLTARETNQANANYNALLAELQHRFSGSFQVDAQYRWSKVIDQGSNDYYIDQHPFNVARSRGPADFDTAHNFKLWGIYTPRIFSGGHSWLEKVAGGWTLSGILNAHSGYPWTPIYGNTGCNLIYQNSGFCNLRPGGLFWRRRQ